MRSAPPPLPPSTPLLADISDTARWVATFRAAEATRPDALFRDPFAARLAGERGRRMAEAMPAVVRRNSWPIVARTKAVDDLVMDAIAGGADRIVNLAAGLDMRPYRLPLPSGLTWIEADLPAMIEDKQRAVVHDRAVCRVRREAVDLGDEQDRRAFLDRATEGATNVAVITEGLLIYLDESAIRGLASDMALRTPIRTWITDLVGPAVLRMLKRQLGAMLPSDARMRFAPENGVAFFEPFGWAAADVRSLFEDAARTGRLPLWLRPFTLFPSPSPTRPGRRPWSAVVRFTRDLARPAARDRGRARR